MAWLSKLFGGAKPAAKETLSEEYKGLRITAAPQKEGSAYRLCAIITGEVDGETREHRVIRADTIQDYDEAVKASVNKAKQVINEQGAAVLK